MQSYLWLRAFRRSAWGITAIAFIIGIISPLFLAFAFVLMILALVLGYIEKTVRIRNKLSVKKRGQPPVSSG